jgi:hypothetical protein
MRLGWAEPRLHICDTITVTVISHRLRLVAGWMAVALSSAVLCLWALIVTAEAFHEGWYDRYLWRNALLTFVQYLGPALALLLPTLAAIRWRRIALPAFLLPAIAAGFILHNGADRAVIAVPLLVAGALFQFGRPEPRRWAWRATLALPAAMALIAAAHPAYYSIAQRPHPEDSRAYWSNMVWGPLKWDGGSEEHAELMVRVKLDGAAAPALMQLDLGTPDTDVYPSVYAQLLGERVMPGTRLTHGTVAGRPFRDEIFDSRPDTPEPDLPGEPIRLGTIGCTFFEHRILILDFVKERLAILGKGADLPAAESRAVEYFPLAYRYRHVFVPATINGHKGPDLMFDTGASMFPLFIGHQWWRELTHRRTDDPANSTVRVSAWGHQAVLIGAPITGDLCIGSACLTNPVVYCEGSGLPNMDMDRYSFLASGVFGNVAFDRRFTVIVDISGRRIGLLKGSIQFSQDYRFPED